MVGRLEFRQEARLVQVQVGRQGIRGGEGGPGDDVGKRGILVKAGDEVKVGTALFVYNTEQTQTELEEAQLEIERLDGEMENLKTQIAQLEKEKKKAAEDEKFSYTTQIQTAQTDLKKSEYEKKAKQVEISQKQDKIANATGPDFRQRTH